MFGEMSILSDAPAAATVLALQESRVLRLPASSFMKVARVYPDVLNLLDSLAHQRRSANQIRLNCPLPISAEEGQAMV
jgi:CRP-like cAMP-binding protein